MLLTTAFRAIHLMALAKQPTARTKAILLDLLFNHPKKVYTRDELLFLIYKIDVNSRESTRQLQANYMMLRKLIQRTRSLLNEIDPKIDWFSYDRKADVWVFCSNSSCDDEMENNQE